MSSTIRMPSLGESVVEGTIGKWLVDVGQRIERDQAVVEILTDKADSEVPSPEAGTVTKLLVKEGDVVAVGAALCEVDENATATAQSKKSKQNGEPAAPVAVKPATASAASAQAVAESRPRPSAKREAALSSPSVRKLAREHDVDLQQLTGSGEGGRITAEDVRRAAEPTAKVEPVAPAQVRAFTPLPMTTPGTHEAPISTASLTGAFRLPPYVPRPGDEVVPLSRRRRIIADHMVYSKLTAPHVVTFAECDLYKTDKLRNEHKDRLKAEGVNLTMLSFVASATARALTEHRAMNARMLQDAYVLLGAINLGIAVDTKDGLVVPVVKHADELTVRGLARAIDAVAQKARDNSLTPDDLAAKTFTISNPGRLGNLVGGAIISQPNVGILRIGEIKKRVVVIEHEGQDLMAIHPVMYMALSYDHRVVDGVAANGFLHRVSEIIENAEFSV